MNVATHAASSSRPIRVPAWAFCASTTRGSSVFKFEGHCGLCCGCESFATSASFCKAGLRSVTPGADDGTPTPHAFGVDNTACSFHSPQKHAFGVDDGP